MSSLINKTGNVMHSQHGFFVSDSLSNANCGKWGTKDGDLIEPLGDLKDVNNGVPNPTTNSIERTNRWFVDKGVSQGKWTVGAKDKLGIASLSTTIEFGSKYGIACYLAKYKEVSMTNLDSVGDALAELYRKAGKDWKLNRKWVYMGLHVESGFILMSLDNDVKVTLTGKGTVDVHGVPVDIEVSGLQTSSKTSAELASLAGVTPFCKLAEVHDPVFSKAQWRQIG